MHISVSEIKQKTADVCHLEIDILEHITPGLIDAIPDSIGLVRPAQGKTSLVVNSIMSKPGDPEYVIFKYTGGDPDDGCGNTWGQVNRDSLTETRALDFCDNIKRKYLISWED